MLALHTREERRNLFLVTEIHHDAPGACFDQVGRDDLRTLRAQPLDHGMTDLAARPRDRGVMRRTQLSSGAGRAVHTAGNAAPPASVRTSGDTVSLPGEPPGPEARRMKALDLVLNAVIVLSATVFLAYLGLLYDFGLFTTLPEWITRPFLDLPVLQYVALAVFIGAMVAKIPVRKAIRRHHLREEPW